MNRRAFLSIPLDAESLPTLQAEARDIPIVTTPAAGYPREYARHSWVLIADAHAWLGRDELGFYAVDAACPHLGCLVRPVDDGFICPCHGSAFGTNGIPIADPARRPLRYFMVDLDSDGRLMIRRDRIVSPDDRFYA